MEFIPLFIIARFSGAFAHKHRLPADYLLGAFLCTGLISVLFTPISYPIEVKFITRVLSGVLIGLKIRREDLSMLPTLWKPLLFLSLSILAYSTALALFLSHVTPITLTTALFACVPGGMADITLMAEEYGADMSQVTLVQLLRLVSLIVIYPAFATSVAKKQHTYTPTSPPTKAENIVPFPPTKHSKTSHHKDSKDSSVTASKKFFPPISQEQLSDGVRTFVFAGFGALLFDHLGVPAGELLGSMTVTLIRNIKWQKGYFYPPLRSMVQTTVGVIIGTTVTLQSVQTLWTMFPITLATVFAMLGFSILMGFLLHRFYHTDLVTALLAVAPGGVQEMILLSDSLGANLSFVTTLQVFRILIVFSVFPLWISFLLTLT